MQETNKIHDRLLKEFTENYMEKLFYFCLKKTESNVEAEDLTQDIALQIITALNKNTIPTSFSAWVWQIARNRYSVWAIAKHISIMEHKLYQNIMLEAYGNPLTAEALSLELGIALPYMEDELEYLTRETVLIKK